MLLYLAASLQDKGLTNSAAQDIMRRPPFDVKVLMNGWMHVYSAETG